MDRTGILTSLRKTAETLGFPLFGVVPAEASRDSEFPGWLEAGCAEGMPYLMKNAQAFQHPEALLPGVKSVIMLGMPYDTVHEIARTEHFLSANLPLFLKFSENGQIPPGYGRVAKYAWPLVDYHDVIRKSLKTLLSSLTAAFPGAKNRGVVDTAPLHEREFARRAGLGVPGMNRMLMHPRFGSAFFLAAILSTAELPEFCAPPENGFSAPQDAETFLHRVHEKCPACEKCLRACPTQALGRGKFDAGRCLNTLLIECRDFLPECYWPAVGNRIFGCDTCQNACPPGFFAVETLEPGLQKPLMIELAPLFSLTEGDFQAHFRHTPFFRPGRDGLLRNAAVVLGNERTPAARAVLFHGTHDPSELVRETCRRVLAAHFS